MSATDIWHPVLEFIHWLNSPAFELFGGPASSWAEVIGFILGVGSTGFAAVESPWCWPFSIINNLVWIPLFFTAGLYADTSLQFGYAVLGSIGLWNWLRGDTSTSHHDLPHALPVTRTPVKEWPLQLLVLILGTCALWYILVKLHDSAPFLDAFTTMFSMIAMWAQIRKYIETWILWVAIDFVYIPLYIIKGLYLTSILTVVFLIFAIWGWVVWKKSLDRTLNPVLTPARIPLSHP